MKVFINKYIKFSKSLDKAFNLFTGEIHQLDENNQTRIHEILEKKDQIHQLDLDLITKQIVSYTHINSNQEVLFKNEIDSYFTNNGALCILPTEKCNLRCTYCYEKFEKPKMKTDVVEGIKNYLDKNIINFRNYDLAWFGGEPLLAIDIIEEITSHYNYLIDKYKITGFKSITSNGTLLSDVNVTLLNKLAIDIFQITLDGPQSVHDSQRHSSNLKGSYRETINGILNLLNSSNSKINLRINLDTNSETFHVKIGEWLKEEIFPLLTPFKNRVLFNVVPIWEADTNSIDGICLKDLEKFKKWQYVNDVLNKNENKNITNQVLEITSHIGSLACYAGKPNHFVIGADGKIYKCTVAFDLKENNIGALLKNGETTIDYNMEKLWTKINSTNDKYCQSCSFNKSCLGIHCPLYRMQKNTNPCPSFKNFSSLIFN